MNCLWKETSSISGSAKPAPTTNSRTRPAWAIKKGPGASGSGGGICPNSTKIVPGSESAGLRSRAAHTEKARGARRGRGRGAEHPPPPLRAYPAARVLGCVLGRPKRRRLVGLLDVVHVGFRQKQRRGRSSAYKPSGREHRPRCSSQDPSALHPTFGTPRSPRPSLPPADGPQQPSRVQNP